MKPSPPSHLIWYPGHELLLKDIVRAENCRLDDSGGRSYVDLESGVWCLPLGHGHPRVLEALTGQAARIGHTGFCYANEAVEEAAREILSLLGFEGGRGTFLCSGSEAVEYGVRAAQSLLERPLLMTMSDSYFGAYGSAHSRRPDEWFSFDWSACAACPREEECGPRCKPWAAIPRERVGGFLFEPGSSSGLVRFPPEKLIRNIADLVRENGGLILVNEVTTGIGRTGNWFGFQHYGLEPDIAALGKGIGNGYPVAAAAFAPRAAALLEAKPLKYSQSHQNDPLGAVVARTVVRVIREEGLIERGREIGGLLARGLEAVKSRSRRVSDVRSRGLMAAIEFHDGPGFPFTIRTHRELVRRGFVVGRRPDVPVLRIDPSLTIDLGDVEAFLATLGDIIGSDG